VSLVLGIAVLAVAVLLGGLAALFNDGGSAGQARGAMSLIRTFAVVAAVSIALLHLLPEAVSAAGWGVLAAAFLGAFGPVALERAVPWHGPRPRATAHANQAPTTALAMGYAAVVAHQAGEGAALASLAETGALSGAIVLAIAAHTVPLAMVVGIRVLEVRGHGNRRAIALALLGVAAATACGAGAGSLIGAARLVAVQPWILATVAGLLLHALAHDAVAPPSASLGARAGDALAGWAGLALALLGVERGGWIDRVPTALRGAGIAVLAGAIAARSFWGGRAAAPGEDEKARQHDHS
jgi:ZIP family zinc transporter